MGAHMWPSGFLLELDGSELTDMNCSFEHERFMPTF